MPVKTELTINHQPKNPDKASANGAGQKRESSIGITVPSMKDAIKKRESGTGVTVHSMKDAIHVHESGTGVTVINKEDADSEKTSNEKLEASEKTPLAESLGNIDDHDSRKAKMYEQTHAYGNG